MSAELSQDQEFIRAELDEARGRLDGLLSDMRSIDAELSALDQERQQFELVDEACASLERLADLGGSKLFFGGFDGDFESHMRLVRGRADQFRERLDAIQVRRDGIAKLVSEEEEASEILEDDLLEAQHEEEMKKLEWVIEREDLSPVFHTARMPWARGGEEDARFRKSLAGSMGLSLLLMLLLPMINLPVPDQWEVVEIPERLTRLIKKDVPPPPPVVQERLVPEETQKEIPDEPEKLAKDTTPKAAPTPEVTETVASKGILALRDQFAGLASSDPAAKLGSSARINRSGESARGRQGRSLVTTQNPAASGGINVASLGRDAVGGGGQALEGVQVGQATSSIGTASGTDRPLSDGIGQSRTDEEIQIVFDRHKSALYRLYNKELRRNPTLQGQIVLKMVIEPDGSVSLCEVKSSDMNAPALAAKVVGRVKLFDFGAKDGIPPVSILYPIDFLPAA